MKKIILLTCILLNVGIIWGGTLMLTPTPTIIPEKNIIVVEFFKLKNVIGVEPDIPDELIRECLSVHFDYDLPLVYNNFWTTLSVKKSKIKKIKATFIVPNRQKFLKLLEKYGLEVKESK